MEEILYQIALTLIPKVGSVNGKNLVAYCGGVKEVFTEKRRNLLQIPGIGEQTVNSILNHGVLERAEVEMEFVLKNNIKTLFYLDSNYPSRLKQCVDSPLLLFQKGNTDLNNQKVIAFVGTRNSTEYGKEVTNSLIAGLANTKALIISGLAYGIDSWAHKSALENELETVAVLGHGLDRIYPYANRSLAERMLNRSGSLLTEFISDTKPDFMNFPMRNRIIAGMVDAVVVIEAGVKGGALITADIANSYNREVFAIPGRVGDSRSEGCNNLIKNNGAILIQNSDDIKRFLNWENEMLKHKPVQRELFVELNDEEKSIVEFLSERNNAGIDEIMLHTSLLPAKAASVLLNLEFKGLVRCLPGKTYKLL